MPELSGGAEARRGGGAVGHKSAFRTRRLPTTSPLRRGERIGRLGARLASSAAFGGIAREQDAVGQLGIDLAAIAAVSRASALGRLDAALAVA